jgi:molecular chaperone HtpG
MLYSDYFNGFLDVTVVGGEREKYEELFRAFGLQLKYGVYADYGMHKDVLKDLILFVSSTEKKYVSLKEYVARMGEEQKHIYYAAGETVDKIDMLPRVEAAKAKGYEVLYLTDDVDEFALKVLGAYAEKEFMNVCDNKLELGSEEEQAAVKAENEAFADLLTAMKEAIGESVHAVRFTADLKNHPVCLTTEGELSTEMEKVLNSMPGSGGMAKAQVVLEINVSDPIAEKLKTLYHADKAKLTDYAKVLYAQARLIGGMTVDNPAEISALICRFLAE